MWRNNFTEKSQDKLENTNDWSKLNYQISDQDASIEKNTLKFIL
jgi:hypothetical protein